MKSKFGSLLAMLLCGASFVTHAVPITYEHDYGGVYDIQCTAGTCAEPLSIAWTFSYTVDPTVEADSAWKYTLSPGTANEQAYESSTGSFFRVFGDTSVAHLVQLVTAPHGITLPELGIDTLLVFLGGGVGCVVRPVCDGLGLVGHWIAPSAEGLAVLHDLAVGELGISLSALTLNQSMLGSFSDPFEVELFGWSFALRGSEFLVQSALVPEPTSLALLGIGLAAFGVSRRRSRG